jgi:fructokinase
MQVVSIGEILWDIFPNQELLGGAALNFSVNVARLGDSVSLMTAVGQDTRGQAACNTMKSLGLSTDFVQVVAHRPTGLARVSTSPDGEPCFEIPRPAAFDEVSFTRETLDSAMHLKPDWLYFGTLMQVEPHVEHGTETLRQMLPGVRCFYDMNLRQGNWNFPLVQRLCRMASVLKLNESEAKTVGGLSGIAATVFTLESFCKFMADRYEIDTICITLGDAGCYVYENGSSHTISGYPIAVRDTVGAGDAFAAAFLHGYHHGWPVAQTARFANALGSIVASRAGATPHWSMQECFRIAAVSPEADLFPSKV